MILENFVTLNCSGQKFLISQHLLDQYPKTLLGNEEKRRVFWDDQDQGIGLIQFLLLIFTLI